ncbi:MAG: hypothetical protein KBD94_09365 [Pyrinomonadaceae bacterium]|nr:hypothetical protein [Pyrinomonadaceae bacterium]
MNTLREQVTSLLDRLPADATIEDLQYQLYVIDKIEKGVESAEREGTLTQEQAEKKFEKWLTK